MTRYIIKRMLMLILIVFVVMFIVFVLMHWVMPATMNLPIDGDGDALDSIFAFFDASSNVFTRYLRYMYNVVFNFYFGTTWLNAPFIFELAERTRNTLIILGIGTVLTLVTGIPLGIYAAGRKDRPGDRIITVITTILSSMPIFAVAFVILVFFVLHLGVLPASWKNVTPSVFIMPVITIALGGIASIARMTRTSMIEVLEQPYITALRAKGLKESHVIYKHALRNALVPVISALGGFISQLFIGLFVVENFFTIHGLSAPVIDFGGLANNLLSVILTLTVILAVLNVASDIAYTIVNPKIKLRYSRRGGNKEVCNDSKAA